MPPIKPTEVRKNIPDIVYSCFNELIQEKYNNGRAIIYQYEILDLITSKGIDRDTIFNKHYLNIEKDYEKEGWQVFYHRSEYGYSNETYFEFKNNL